jgi:DNA polymerase I-like protein with 3'-5' exonuclease and polymerase domains
MQILTVDFETFYSQEFSLTKLTTEEYVRSPEFEVIGVSVQVDDGEPVWFTGSMPDTEDWLKQFDWGKSLALAHNAMFDAAILTWLFGIRPKGWLDTLSMGRALHGTEVGGSLAVLAKHYELGVKGEEVIAAKGLRRLDFPPEQLAKYGKYCCNDVALTYALFNKLAEKLPAMEFRLIDLTIRMYSDPVLRLNPDFLRHHIAKLAQRRKELLENFDEDTLMSNPQFADVLASFGVIPPMKVSPTTGKMTYAFAKNDEEFKALLEHPDVNVQNLVSARLGAKSTLEHTRAQRFLDIAERTKDRLLPVPLRYYAAHTGRWGGDDKLNLQNLPRESQLKNAIKAPPGYVLIDADSSQIEARTLAWLAVQDDLVEVFNKNNEEIAAKVPKKEFKYDPYKLMASKIYNKPVHEITDNERFMGKTTILGAGYGMGANKFQAQLKAAGRAITEEESARIILTYRQSYPRITTLWKNANAVLLAVLDNKSAEFGRDGLLKVDGKRGIRLPNGLYIAYPNIRLEPKAGSDNPELVYDTKRGKQVVSTRIYGGKVVENVCQALARIIIGEQMLMIAKKYRVVMTVHDAIACVVPQKEAEQAVEYVEMCMRIRPAWAPDLPLNCESGYGSSYGDC